MITYADVEADLGFFLTKLVNLSSTSYCTLREVCMQIDILSTRNVIYLELIDLASLNSTSERQVGTTTQKSATKSRQHMRCRAKLFCKCKKNLNDPLKLLRPIISSAMRFSSFKHLHLHFHVSASFQDNVTIGAGLSPVQVSKGRGFIIIILLLL